MLYTIINEMEIFYDHANPTNLCQDKLIKNAALQQRHDALTPKNVLRLSTNLNDYLPQK